jgi:ankyrin repeat domain-containing protein 50
LNPSKQEASLAIGLEYISGLIVQSSIRESLYRRRYESNSSNNDHDDLLPSHIAYRDTLKELYTRILKYQATVVCYYSKNTATRVISDMVKHDDWDSLLDYIKTQEEEFCKINELWKDNKYEEECTALDKRHQESMKSLVSIGTDVSGLRKAIEDAQRDKQRTALLTWLSSIDPSENYNSAREKHEAETGSWLVDDNENFKCWEFGPNSLLWLHGKGTNRMYKLIPK